MREVWLVRGGRGEGDGKCAVPVQTAASYRGVPEAAIMQKSNMPTPVIVTQDPMNGPRTKPFRICEHVRIQLDRNNNRNSESR